MILTAVYALNDSSAQVPNTSPQVTEQALKLEAKLKRWTHNGQIPSYLYPYYVLNGTQKYGIHELAEFLEQRAWLGRRYQAAGFDCSEMSAFLEASLEGDGWHTYIAVGPCPFGPDSSHAWLLVETSPDSYMPIEATAPAIVYWSDPYFDEYFEYDRFFETIFEALEYSPTEFDWWNSLVGER